MCITLKANSQLDYTTVSNAFIDNYMPQANGEFVKIYLYLLRCMSDSSMDLSISTIADKFDQTEKDVVRALRYFAGKGLLSIEYGSDDELSSITFLPITSEFSVVTDNPACEATSMNKVIMQPASQIQNVQARVQVSAADMPQITQDNRTESVSELPQKPSYSPAMLLKFTEEEDISQLLYVTQKYLGRTLSNTEAGTIIYLYDSLSFSTDLIEHLVEHCVSRGHKNMRYIEKVALDWASAGIDTVDAAREYAGNHSHNIYSVMKAFGLNDRCPAEIERQYINRWFQDYGFEADIIVEACNRTIQTIHKPSFEYADSILKHWKQNNVITLQDIDTLDLQYNARKSSSAPVKTASTVNKFNNYPQRDYDFEQLEKILLNN